MLKFYREKNALSINGAEVYSPADKESLFEELIFKLKEKANHVLVIYDSEMRNDYLKKKNKYEMSLEMSESMVKSILAERLAVDLFQIYFDIISVLEINTETELDTNLNYKFIDEVSIRDALDTLCDDFLIMSYEDKKLLLKKFNDIILSYLDIYHFSAKDIESKRLVVLEKEGSFYNGKIVKV